ncbi:MAG: PIG-L family deacetylase, partial [Planctomycetes bacterium]|nr:PIG-L family deacetylase [Planctomycetota bacterium]
MANILAIGVHPDDIEIGVGATLHKLIREGHRVACVDITDG